MSNTNISRVEETGIPKVLVYQTYLRQSSVSRAFHTGIVKHPTTINWMSGHTNDDSSFVIT
jgi:hypothetical protein